MFSFQNGCPLGTSAKWWKTSALRYFSRNMYLWHKLHILGKIAKRLNLVSMLASFFNWPLSHLSSSDNSFSFFNNRYGVLNAIIDQVPFSFFTLKFNVIVGMIAFYINFSLIVKDFSSILCGYRNFPFNSVCQFRLKVFQSSYSAGSWCIVPVHSKCQRSNNYHSTNNSYNSCRFAIAGRKKKYTSSNSC